MSNTQGKKFAKRASVAGAGALALVVGGLAMTAGAASTSFAAYDEDNSPNPVTVTGGLAYYKAADMAWFVGEPGTLVPIEDVDSLAYTVTDSEGFAPSYQLVVLADRFDFDKGTNVTQKYTRLVWEPYMQDAKLDPNAGDYTNVEDGDWWTSKIPTGPGSQDDPQPLSFFTDAVADGGAGWNNVNVFAFAVHQGTTTEATSIVSSITYQGTEVAIGKADLTPFDQADIDEAVAPVQDELDTYKAGHSISDDVNINWSRAALVGTPVHGKTVSVKLSGTIANAASHAHYQWYLAGKPVVGATNASYFVPKNATGKSVSVKVTGESKGVEFGVFSPAVAAK